MKRFTFFLLLLAAIGVAYEHRIGQRLRYELAIERERAAQVATLRSERDRLTRSQMSDDALAALKKAATAASGFALETPSDTAPAPALSSVQMGEWSSAQVWKNRGQTTPAAALETALFAAAGGDIGLFSNLIELPADLRAKVAQLHAGLSPEYRAAYPTPEALVSALAIRRIPVGDAQLVWSQPWSEETAGACILLRNPTTPTGSTDWSNDSFTPKSGEKAPPQGAADPKRKAVMLSFHRSADGWRLVVPVEAFPQMVKDLTGADKSPDA